MDIKRLVKSRKRFRQKLHATGSYALCCGKPLTVPELVMCMTKYKTITKISFCSGCQPMNWYAVCPSCNQIQIQQPSTVESTRRFYCAKCSYITYITDNLIPPHFRETYGTCMW